jgi:NapC/NirT cytochrome c family, N-terminal region
MGISALTLLALTCAAIASVILIVYLVRRPPLIGATKLWLLLGLGVFPVGAAVAGNIEGFESTKKRKLCNSCHVMYEHVADSNDLNSKSLASRHSRNNLFGLENCYMCHRDYGMYGTLTTKIGGLRHVWMYYTRYFNVPIEESRKTIHIYHPYPNGGCMQCHSTRLDVWAKEAEHRGLVEEVRADKVACASGGCHGFAHPFTKSPEDMASASVIWRGEKNRPRAASSASPQGPER